MSSVESTASTSDERPGGVPGLPPDWPAQATSKVVGVVDTVRAKTSGPAIKVSRMVVYGLVAGLLGLLALPLVVIGLVRGITELVDNVWITYLILGALFNLIGVFFWSRRPRGAAS